MASAGLTEPGLLQTEVGGKRSDPLRAWRVIVATLMLKQTRNEQARPILAELFEKWPTPAHLCSADERLEELLRPAGLQNRRAAELRIVSGRYLSWLESYVPDPGRRGRGVPAPPWRLVRTWQGCGQYVEDAVRLLIWSDCEKEPEDRRLKDWWKWKTSS